MGCKKIGVDFTTLHDIQKELRNEYKNTQITNVNDTTNFFLFLIYSFAIFLGNFLIFFNFFL